MHERYVIEHYLQTHSVKDVWYKTNDKIRRETLRIRNYLQELELFSPSVQQDGSVTCTTCALKDDGSQESCECRRIFITQSPTELDFSLDSLKKFWILYHQDQFPTSLFCLISVNEDYSFFGISPPQLPFNTLDVCLYATGAFQHLAAYWLNTGRPPEIFISITGERHPPHRSVDVKQKENLNPSG